MLNFEQWLEVEKVVGHNKTILEQMKDCWNYSAEKIKEELEESTIDKYESMLDELETENFELENENDELGCKCDELENIVSKVENITKELLKYDGIDDNNYLKTKLKSMLDIIKDYC